MKQFKTISVPKFRIGRYKLNEYELRQLLLDVAKGENTQFLGAKVTDCTTSDIAFITNNGLSDRLYGLDISTKIALEHMNFKNQFTN
jgi:hypothetical protein